MPNADLELARRGERLYHEGSPRCRHCGRTTPQLLAGECPTRLRRALDAALEAAPVRP